MFHFTNFTQDTFSSTSKKNCGEICFKSVGGTVFKSVGPALWDGRPGAKWNEGKYYGANWYIVTSYHNHFIPFYL